MKLMTSNQYIDSAKASFENLLRTINSDIFMNGLIKSVENAEIILDIDKAVYYSTDQDAQDHDFGIRYWTEILEFNTNILDSTEVTIALPDQGRELVRFTSSLSLELVEKIGRIISIKNLPNEVKGVVCENFSTFFIEYSYFQELHPFSEKLLDIYKIGGFPCGWRGDFPKGEILIYSKNI